MILMNEQITGTLFKEMIIHAAAAITTHQQEINDLNVFPVPDGDTGTNMSMTIETAVTELQKVTPESVDQAASITASALLRGARGNSGVILSLLFRGLSRGLKGEKTASASAFAAAMQEGVSSAYSAVMHPAEGTILTVSRLAAKQAVDVTAQGEEDIKRVLSEALRAGREVLAQTTELNPVLKKAGVVDAGGKGYILILEGMLAALRGERLQEVQNKPKKKANFAALSDEEITFTFDTVFIVRKAENVSLEPFRSFLASMGDSLVIGEDDESFKVHVHTDTPGDALNEAQKYGILELAKIENMRLQYEDMAAGRKTRSTDDLEAVEEELESMEENMKKTEKASEAKETTQKYGFLSVCAGEGLASIFRDLGVDGIVSGGQTMNPSTESILEEIEKINAEYIFILPNNGNIIMAAQQCENLTDKHTIVIPTKTIPQGITAMMNVDFDAPDPDSLAETMNSSLDTVTTIQVTYAARDSDFDGFDIKAGDYLALEEGKLFGTDKSIETLLERIAKKASEANASFISIYFGQDVNTSMIKQAGEIFERTCPYTELAVLPGGQPVYYYIISIE